MTLGKILDLSIKMSETNDIERNKFFMLNNRRYDNYVDNKSWEIFVEEMEKKYPVAFLAYGKGSGDELGIKKIGCFPPKMASYGSSSRMIYLLSRDINSFCFERKMPTTVGGIANMDGYLHKDDTCFYIEAKCRETYSPTSYIINRKYEALYRYLDQEASLDFNCKINIINDKQMNVCFIAKGNEIMHFDVKQMICHLLGIATEKLNHPSNEKISFLYLLYNPKLIELINSNHKKKILSIYETEILECESIPFKNIFRTIMKYLHKQLGVGNDKITDDKIETISKNFTFSHCDQLSYEKHFKQND